MQTFIPSRASSWSIQDLRALRSLVEQGHSVQVIATRLRRTISSVRNKALMQGLSVSMQPVRPAPSTDVPTNVGATL